VRSAGTWTSRKGRIFVRVSASRVGADWCFFVTGGDRPHLGAVGWKEAGEPGVSHGFPGHRDQAVVDIVLATLAPMAGRHVVLAGIHLDDITPLEIEQVLQLCRTLAQRVLASLSKAQA